MGNSSHKRPYLSENHPVGPEDFVEVTFFGRVTLGYNISNATKFGMAPMGNSHRGKEVPKTIS